MRKLMLNKCILIIGMLLSVSFLCACSSRNDAQAFENSQEVYNSNVITLGLTPNLNYEVDKLRPHILIDEEGYATGGKKVLFIIGEELDTQFELTDTDSRETVYTGKLLLVREDYSEKGNLYMGEFTEVYTPGRYRVHQAQIGYSYEFEIKDEIYKSMYKELYDCLLKLESDDNSENCYRIATMIFAHEIYPDAYINKYYLKAQIENLLMQQEVTSQSIYSHVQTKESIEKAKTRAEKNQKNAVDELEISLSATAEFAGVMANYYHDFYEDDTELATQCLQAATQAYVSMVKYRDNVTTDAWYYAAASLYRATGNETYKNAITEYDQLSQRSKTVSDMDYRMLADMAYLNTEYRADYSKCEEIMKEYKAKAAKIADESGRQNMYVRADIDTTDDQEILTDMMILGTVDYVLSGGEYSSVKENYLHYYFGRNKDAINRLNEAGISEGKDVKLTESIQSLSKLIYILGYDDKKE